MTNNMYKFEEELYDQGITIVCGVDEAGRGPLAGPVVVAACILPPLHHIDEVNDSKQLSKKKREKLYKQIVEEALAYNVVFVYEDQIDKYNIYEATKMGMLEAINGLKVKPQYALIDFMPLNLDIPSNSITKGDALSASIAAASILAKVERDNYMAKMDIKYPNYGFKHNQGYPTKMHMEAIKKYGPSPIHRKTFGPVADYYKEHAQMHFDLFEEEK